jgi:tRNA threonylcarbamoyladenosine biosynthesis protein TsaB
MPSLRQLLAQHDTLLVIDTCATRADAALWKKDSQPSGQVPISAPFAPLQHFGIEGEAAHALPLAVARVLELADMNVARLGAVAFCTGPGSVLGIRIAAASVRVWRTTNPGLAVYGYLSLPLFATQTGALATSVIADARRETWHLVRPDGLCRVERVPSASLASAGALSTPASFRRWSALPGGNPPRELPYNPAQLIADSPDAELFSPEPDPDAFMHELPSYATWTPQVHQAAPSTHAT